MWIPSLLIGAVLALQPAPTLSLNEAENMALTNAFGLRIAQSAIERARQQVIQAQGAFGPQFGLQGQYMRYDRSPSSGFTVGGVTVGRVPIDAKSASASLTYNVDISGIQRRSVEAAQLSRQASEQSFLAERSTVLAQVRTGYFNVLSAQSNVQVRQEALDVTQRRLNDVRRRFEVGVVPQFDVLRVETEVSRAQADFVQAQTTLRFARNALNNILGRPIATPFEVEEIAQAPSVGGDDDTLMALATETRAELKALQLQVRALGKLRETEERGLRPGLALSAVYTRTIDAPSTSRENQVVGVATLSVPLWDQGVTRARVRAAREDERQAAIRLEQATLGVTLEVRQALVRIRNAREQLAVADRLVTQQTEAVRLAELRYEVGEGILLELNEAQTDLTAARVSQVAARYELYSAIAQLQQAVGRDDLTAPAPAPSN